VAAEQRAALSVEIRRRDVENIITEFKIVETDDGFRIEIKGNKEKIRRLMENLGPHSFFGGPLRGPFRRSFRFGFGPGPGFWGGWYDPTSEEPRGPRPDDKMA
jgi:hypothetical protein